jgi:uncharacterized membrane protein
MKTQNYQFTDLLFAIAVGSAFLYNLGGQMEWIATSIGMVAAIASIALYFKRHFGSKAEKAVEVRLSASFRNESLRLTMHNPAVSGAYSIRDLGEIREALEVQGIVLTYISTNQQAHTLKSIRPSFWLGDMPESNANKICQTLNKGNAKRKKFGYGYEPIAELAVAA